MTRNRVVTILLAMLFAFSAFFVLLSLSGGLSLTDKTLPLASLLLLGVLFIVHLRGWRWSGEATIVLLVILVVLSSNPSVLRSQLALSLLMPTVLAGTLLTPIWTLIVYGATIGGVLLNVLLSTGGLARADLGPTFGLINGSLLTLIAVGIVVASAVSRQAQGRAEEQTRRAERVLVQVEQQARDLAQQVTVAAAAQRDAEHARSDVASQLETIATQQAVIRDLSVPVLPLSSQTLVMPLIGALDSARLQALQEQALESVAASTARYLIMDVTGVPLIDTAVAGGLIRTIQAIGLLGAEVILVGIRPELAQTIVGLGLDLSSITSRSNLEDGIRYAQL